MESLNAAKIIEECKMSGEAVTEIVASYGEDEFIHTSDIEEFSVNHDRLVEENAELRKMLSRDKTAFINQIELDLIRDSAKQETRELAESIHNLLAKHKRVE